MAEYINKGELLAKLNSMGLHADESCLPGISAVTKMVYGMKPRTGKEELPTIEELMEPMCDQCQWPGWYKDPDDLFREKCSDCPVEKKLAEALYGET